MSLPLPRDDYRYTVEVNGETVTPLASAQCFLGEEAFRILNISRGGVALLCNRDPVPFREGDRVGMGIEIRGRSFPIEIEILRLRGLRANCQFVNPSRMFQGALKEFLQPKFLGETLVLREDLTKREDILGLVENAERYEAHIGQNQTGFFVWLKAERVLARIVGVSQDLIFEWTDSSGLRTGRISAKAGPRTEPVTIGDDSEIQWARVAEDSLLHYFADIMLAWLHQSSGREFVQNLFNDEDSPEAQTLKLRFPRV